MNGAKMLRSVLRLNFHGFLPTLSYGVNSLKLRELPHVSKGIDMSLNINCPNNLASVGTLRFFLSIPLPAVISPSTNYSVSLPFLGTRTGWERGGRS